MEKSKTKKKKKKGKKSVENASQSTILLVVQKGAYPSLANLIAIRITAFHQ